MSVARLAWYQNMSFDESLSFRGSYVSTTWPKSDDPKVECTSWNWAWLNAL
jgi:hypothetical protein